MYDSEYRPLVCFNTACQEDSWLQVIFTLFFRKLFLTPKTSC